MKDVELFDKVEELGMSLASTALLEEKALQGCANASLGHSNSIVVSKVLVLQRED